MADRKKSKKPIIRKPHMGNKKDENNWKKKKNDNTEQTDKKLVEQDSAKQEAKINFWRSLSQSPISNRLQKINLVVTTFLAIISATLALLTFNQSAKIEGMQEILESFKPYVSLKAPYFRVNSDSLFLSARLKNYGQRGAKFIQVEYYTVLDSIVHLEPEYTDLYLSPNEELEYNDSFNYKGYFDTTNIMTDLSRTGRLFFVFKFKYEDEVLNVVDSNYEFLSNQKLKGNLLVMEPSTDSIIHFIKALIRGRIKQDF